TFHHGVNDGAALASGFTTNKKPVLLADRRRPDAIFEEIGINFEMPILSVGETIMSFLKSALDLTGATTLSLQMQRPEEINVDLSACNDESSLFKHLWQKFDFP